MGDLINLFAKQSQTVETSLDATALAFAPIDQIRLAAWPFIQNEVSNGTDMPILRTLNVVATMLLDPAITEHDARVGGWASLDARKEKGFDLLTLVNELWNEAVTRGPKRS